MLKEEWLEIREIEQLVKGPEKVIIKKIKEAREKDEKVIKVVEEIKKSRSKNIEK